MKKRTIALALLGIFFILQFFQTDKTNPEINASQTFATLTNPPAEHLAQLRTSCYDCHSNETIYPWYTYVAPVSFWINGHIINGRKALNFSEWGNYSASDQKHMLHEMVEEIEEGHMPPKGYYRMHDGAYLEGEAKTALMTWLNEKSPL